MASETVLDISPPHLAPWLSDNDVETSLVILDFYPDVLDKDRVRLNLEVGFNAIRVRRRGALAEADYYIGCTGAEITVIATGGRIRQFTPDSVLDVSYKGTSEVVRSSKVTLKTPDGDRIVKSKRDDGLAVIALEAGTKRSTDYSFGSHERVLAALAKGRSVSWRIDFPNIESVVRDFLFGNIYLFADCEWGTRQKRGRLVVRPSDLRFFDPQRRVLDSAKGILMLYALWKARKDVHARSGIEITFVEVER